MLDGSGSDPAGGEAIEIDDDSEVCVCLDEREDEDEDVCLDFSANLEMTDMAANAAREGQQQPSASAQIQNGYHPATTYGSANYCEKHSPKRKENNQSLNAANLERINNGFGTKSDTK